MTKQFKVVKLSDLLSSYCCEMYCLWHWFSVNHFWTSSSTQLFELGASYTTAWNTLWCLIQEAVPPLCGLVGHTGWGKIPSLLSVGHCEGSGGRRRVGLGSKGAGSWEVPVTTLHSRKDVWSNEQRAFAVETYFSQSHSIVVVQRAFCTLPNPPSGPSTGPKIHSVVGWEPQGNGKCVWKKMRTTTDLSNTRERRGGPFCSLPGALHANNGYHLQDILFKTVWFKTSHVVVSESENKIFVSNSFFVIHFKI